MIAKAVAGFLLLLVLSEAASQTVGGILSVSPSTGSTCGVGSSDCPTDPALDATEIPTEIPVSLETSTSTSTEPASGNDSTTPSVATTAQETITQSPMVTSSKPNKGSSTTRSPPRKLPTTVKQPEGQILGYALSETCACDLMAFSCDINCCCDPDCTNFQHAAFSKCKVEGYPPYDNRYCYASKLVFLNNSEHILEQSQSGAFCIVRSNLAASVLYPSHPVFLSLQDFLRHWDRTHTPVWPELQAAPISVVEKPKPYSAGSPILLIRNSQSETFDLPASRLTAACSVKNAVLYLLPWSSKCMRKAPDGQHECDSVSSYIHYQLQNIVRSPLLVNQTELPSETVELCPENVCAPVTYFICSGSKVEEDYYTNNCKNISSKNVLFGLKNGVCFGVVKRLRLLFHHNGTDGILHIEAFMWLSNISLSDYSVTKPLHQSFSVQFKWARLNKTVGTITKNNTLNSMVEHAPFPRSGNPGYLIGQPVIAAFRVKQKLSANSSKDTSKDSAKLAKHDTIDLSHDPKQWLTLPGSNMNGMCDVTLAQRHIVTFGEDLHMSCGIAVSPRNISSHFSCNALRSRLLQLLLGDIAKSFHNGSFNADWGRIIAAFGSANVSKPQEWVPLLLDSQPPFTLLSEDSMSTIESKISNEDKLSDMSIDHPLQMCENVPLGIQLQLMHGRVGSPSNPQSKIFGAAMRFTPLQDIGWPCTSAACPQKQDALYLRVVSTVKFVDISSPAVTRFAEPPAIHIRLPPDFFYPFMATEGSSGASIHKTSMALVAAFLIPLLFI
ncbi:tectonic-1 [Thrips palmi]|uniref:Tectonic-1 n=1 Tax=Thrips palmi TaxID=161013 RepID=A0A6P8Y4T3_THRPL|nr:tectonic-1 [Thrips palmi]